MKRKCIGSDVPVPKFNKIDQINKVTVDDGVFFDSVRPIMLYLAYRGTVRLKFIRPYLVPDIAYYHWRMYLVASCAIQLNSFYSCILSLCSMFIMFISHQLHRDISIQHDIVTDLTVTCQHMCAIAIKFDRLISSYYGVNNLFCLSHRPN